MQSYVHCCKTCEPLSDATGLQIVRTFIMHCKSTSSWINGKEEKHYARKPNRMEVKTYGNLLHFINFMLPICIQFRVIHSSRMAIG